MNEIDKCLLNNDIFLMQKYIDEGLDVNEYTYKATHYISSSTIMSFTTYLLHHAVCYKNKEFIELLIKNGADINKKDKYNKNPLNYCFTIDIAKILIEKGCDVYNYDRSNNCLLDNFCKEDDFDAIKYILTFDIQPRNLSVIDLYIEKFISYKEYNIAKALLKYLKNNLCFLISISKMHNILTLDDLKSFTDIGFILPIIEIKNTLYLSNIMLSYFKENDDNFNDFFKLNEDIITITY